MAKPKTPLDLINCWVVVSCWWALIGEMKVILVFLWSSWESIFKAKRVD